MERTWWEKIEGTTDQILSQLRKIVEEGNVRRVVVKQRGKTVAEFPLTVGVVGAVLAPVAAAIGALTALLADCTIEVEKTAASDDPTARPPGQGCLACPEHPRSVTFSGFETSHRRLRSYGSATPAGTPLPGHSGQVTVTRVRRTARQKELETHE